jgi:hypothetical protein
MRATSSAPEKAMPTSVPKVLSACGGGGEPRRRGLMDGRTRPGNRDGGREVRARGGGKGRRIASSMVWGGAAAPHGPAGMARVIWQCYRLAAQLAAAAPASQSHVVHDLEGALCVELLGGCLPVDAGGGRGPGLHRM